MVTTGADALPIEVLAGAMLSAAENKDTAVREGWRARGSAFFQRTLRARYRPAQDASSHPPNSNGTLPLLAARARRDTREWVMKRRERTRQLIDLGGLIVKAELVELTEDDRAVIFGALLNVAAKLRSEEREHALMLWRHAGSRAFAAEDGR